jgi:hypothetical protein
MLRSAGVPRRPRAYWADLHDPAALVLRGPADPARRRRRSTSTRSDVVMCEQPAEVAARRLLEAIA